MLDEAGADPPFAQPQVALEDGHGTRAQGDAAIFAGLGDILVDAVDAGLRNTQHAMTCIVVSEARRRALIALL